MKTPLSLTLAALLAAALLFLPAALAQNEPAKSARPMRPSDEQLALAFRSYERLSLDTAEAAAHVRETGRLRIDTGRRAFDLELEPHDMRAENYRAEESVAPGVTLALARGPVRTYRGKVARAPDAEARFTIDEESFEGVILTSDERYYVEPAARFTSSAAPTDFLLYKASDVIENEPFACAAPSLHDRLGEASDRVSKEPAVSAAVSGGGPSPYVLASPLEAELATEADFEYSTALGGAAAANSEILSVMNQVEGVYQREIGLSFKIVYQHVWTTSADPYTSADPVLAVKEFTNEWNKDPHGVGFRNVARDLAHMWTGKNLTNTAGVAWTGVVCKSPASAYGLSERIAATPQKFVLPAHEIGHNFNASHSDGVSGCANTIMQAVATNTSVLSFCQTSRTQIETFINANSSCLSPAPACAFTISPTSASHTASGGAGSVTVTTTAACDWTAASNVSWLHITAGASGSGNGSVSYTVDANTSTTSRQGTLTIAGRTFTVTQAGAAACTFSISPTSATFTSAGGTGQISVATAAGCAWTAKSNVAWITITAGATGTGSGTVSYSVAANTSTASRQGTITAAGKTFTVTQGGASPSLSSLVVNPPTVIGGCQSATGSVTLSAPAPSGGITVKLSDNLAATTLPASVTVAAGARSRTFNITTAAVSANQSGTVTATLNGVTRTDTLTVRAISVRSVSVRPNPIIGGNTAAGTVTLECPAAPGNITVTLSDNLAATTLPASVTVAAGTTTKTFNITTTPVASNQVGTLIAKAGGVSKSVAVTVRRIGVLSLKLNPTSVTGGQNSTGTVTLERPAGPSSIVVTLKSSNPTVASVPSSVTIPAGTTSRTFTVTTSGVSSPVTVTITATANSTSKSATLTVNPEGSQ